MNNNRLGESMHLAVHILKADLTGAYGRLEKNTPLRGAGNFAEVTFRGRVGSTA